jgi:CRP/FNR family cyclic AMP-dependent transcriptional regulator
VRIIQTLAERLASANRQIKTLALGDSRARLADLLLFLKDEFGQADAGMPVIPLTHQEIADLAGISRETATRLLNTLETEGAVRLKSRRVVLSDPEALKRYAT